MTWFWIITIGIELWILTWWLFKPRQKPYKKPCIEISLTTCEQKIYGEILPLDVILKMYNGHHALYLKFDLYHRN